MTALAAFHSPALQATDQVIRFEGHETINSLYVFDIRLLVPREEATSVTQRALGEPGWLTLQQGDGPPREIRGMLACASAHEVLDSERAIISLQLVPHLFRLDLMVGDKVNLARTLIPATSTPRYYFRSGGKSHTGSNSWSVFYWMLRYDIVENDDGSYEPRERIQIFDLNALLKS